MIEKIIIEESITATIKTGVGKHTLMLNEIIKHLNIDYEIVSNKIVEKIKNPILKRFFYLIWLNTFFISKLLFEKNNTTVIYTSFLPVIKLKKIQQVGIIHDVLLKVYPENMSKGSLLLNRFLNASILSKADKILTVSNTVKNEILQYYNFQPDKIFVVYNSFSLRKDSIHNELETLKKYGLQNFSKKYILYVSSMNKNKNIQLLIEAFNIISKENKELKLVLTGGKPDIIKKYLKDCDNENIIFTGYVPDTDLAIIYNNALLYVFPSIYEGFGIPIIDAQLFNIPVLCSDIPIFREVGNDSVEYIKLQKQNLSEKIINIINDQESIETLKNLGTKNIQNYSFDKIKEQLRNVF